MKGHYQRPSYFREVPQIIKGKIVKKFIKVVGEKVKLKARASRIDTEMGLC